MEEMLLTVLAPVMELKVLELELTMLTLNTESVLLTVLVHYHNFSTSLIRTVLVNCHATIHLNKSSTLPHYTPPPPPSPHLSFWVLLSQQGRTGTIFSQNWEQCTVNSVHPNMGTGQTSAILEAHLWMPPPAGMINWGVKSCCEMGEHNLAKNGSTGKLDSFCVLSLDFM